MEDVSCASSIHCIYFIEHMWHIPTDVHTTHKSSYMWIHYIYIMVYTAYAPWSTCHAYVELHMQSNITILAVYTVMKTQILHKVGICALFLFCYHFEYQKTLLSSHFHSLIEEGGDWDRRNRLKVYRGTYCMAIRDFKTAANLFLDTVATFTSYELMDYKSFVKYTVLCSMIALERPVLREKVKLQITLYCFYCPCSAWECFVKQWNRK